MIDIEARIPPPEYLPERTPKPAPRIAPKPIWWTNDLAASLYRGWVHDCWALRFWKTNHNCFVEHWHGVSRPGKL